MTNRLTVAFQLTGTALDPRHVSDALGIECTESQVSEGEAVNFWILSTGRQGNIDISEACHEIVDALQPHQDTIRKLVATYGLTAGLSLDVEIGPRTDREVLYGELPLTGFRFDTEIVGFLSAVGAAIYVDLECEREADHP